MTVLNYEKSRMALMLGGSTVISPSYFMIGNGSSTVSPSNTTLQTATDRQEVTSTDVSETYKVKWTGDWNSLELSGTSVSEFGICGSATGTTGSMWSRIVIPSINFDGTNEMRVEETHEVF